jgi:hypothetical protein
VSDPYDSGSSYQPYQPSGGGEPGEQEPAPPYGAPAARHPGTDPVSIAGLVCSLLCCTAPVGLGLGIAGLVRTKSGRRAGRWAALTAVVAGVLGTIALVGSLIGIVWIGANVVTPESADPGDCIDIGTGDSDDLDLWAKSCDEPHDAEVVFQGDFDRDLLEAYEEQQGQDFCLPLLSERYRQVVTDGPYVVDVAVDGDDPESGDAFICFAEPLSGDLEQPLLD